MTLFLFNQNNCFFEQEKNIYLFTLIYSSLTPLRYEMTKANTCTYRHAELDNKCTSLQGTTGPVLHWTNDLPLLKCVRFIGTDISERRGRQCLFHILWVILYHRLLIYEITKNVGKWISKHVLHTYIPLSGCNGHVYVYNV